MHLVFVIDLKRMVHEMVLENLTWQLDLSITHVLVYKQTIMPLVEYVSFVLYLNNAKETDTLQK